LKASKERITTYLDTDLLKHFRDEAKKTGEKYQSLINRALRQKVFDEKDINSRIEALENLVKSEKKIRTK